jgi:FkbM family methyltransferase
MRTSTRLVFKSLLKHCGVDCIFDVGACDGYESLVFRQVFPKATLAAFEANPFLYKKITANPEFARNRVEVFPYAVSNQRGRAAFHVIDVDYDDPGKNRGESSLLTHENYGVKETVEVETIRLDEFLPSRYPGARRIGLWIDVEGAEFDVLSGIAGIKDRVVAVHVETASVPYRVGQKVYREVEALMKSLGFVPVATSLSKKITLGDVVFANEKMLANLGLRYHFCQWIGWLSYCCQLHALGAFLKKHCHPLYQPLWRLYVRLFT